MLRTDLLEMIRNGESSGVDFKRDDIDPRMLAKELVAFANASGGTVLLGVEDDGSISGLTRDRLAEWVMQVARDKIRPEIIPYFEVVRDVEPGRDVGVVRLTQGYSVHNLWDGNHRTYLIRVGTTCREASPEELQRLFQQRSGIRGELQPISGTTAQELDLGRLTDYFGRVRGQEVPPTQNEWNTLLTNTEFLVQTETGSAATVAGVLLFGTNPKRWLPQSGVDAVAYPGTEKEYAAEERTLIAGPLVPLCNPAGQVLDNGLPDQALEFVRRHVAIRGTLDDAGRRIEEFAYPMEAVREVVVNALIHRDYLLSGTTIELSIYSDRLEIISPGRLPNGVTPAGMRAGVRAARNPLLKDVMRDYRYLEHMGMGIPRKVVKLMREQNGTDPDLEQSDERFTVRLWKERR